MSKTVEFAATRLIPVPVDVLWSITADPRRNADWGNNVKSVQFRGGPAVVGDRFTERSVVIGPIVSTTEWTVTSITPMRERVFVGSGFPGVGEVQPFTRFEPFTDAHGREHTYTTYGSRLTLEVGIFSALYGKLLTGMINAEFADSLETLEQIAVRENRTVAQS